MRYVIYNQHLSFRIIYHLFRILFILIPSVEYFTQTSHINSTEIIESSVLCSGSRLEPKNISSSLNTGNVCSEDGCRFSNVRLHLTGNGVCCLPAFDTYQEPNEYFHSFYDLTIDSETELTICPKNSYRNIDSIDCPITITKSSNSPTNLVYYSEVSFSCRINHRVNEIFESSSYTFPYVQFQQIVGYLLYGNDSMDPEGILLRDKLQDKISSHLYHLIDSTDSYYNTEYSSINAFEHYLHDAFHLIIRNFLQQRGNLHLKIYDQFDNQGSIFLKGMSSGDIPRWLSSLIILGQVYPALYFPSFGNGAMGGELIQHVVDGVRSSFVKDNGQLAGMGGIRGFGGSLFYLESLGIRFLGDISVEGTNGRYGTFGTGGNIPHSALDLYSNSGDDAIVAIQLKTQSSGGGGGGAGVIFLKTSDSSLDSSILGTAYLSGGNGGYVVPGLGTSDAFSGKFGSEGLLVTVSSCSSFF